MQRLEIKLSNRKGFTLILSALLIFVLIGAAVMAVDVGHMQVRRADIQAAADAAALAGIEEFAATRGNVWAPDSAHAEADSFAHRFKADTAHLAVANFKLGYCAPAACTPAVFHSPPLTGEDTNAAQATVQYTGNLTFAPVLFGHISQHASAATSVAVGVSRSVTASTCVSPVVVSYADLIAQIGNGKKVTDPLTSADIDSLVTATAGKAVTLSIPNGSQVNSLDPGQFYQIELPPLVLANGTVQSGVQSPSASTFRNAFTCTGGNPTISLGDWLAIVPGQKANQAKDGVDNASCGGCKNPTFPVTMEVVFADLYGTPPGCPGGCLQVRYLGAFVATQEPDSKGVTGYFTAFDPKAGGVVGTSTAPGPLNEIKTRLVY